jgi:hypothetical protein
MNAITISRVGNRGIEWDKPTLSRVLAQLRLERELSNFIRLMELGCACAGEALNFEAETHISHANDSTA